VIEGNRIGSGQAKCDETLFSEIETLSRTRERVVFVGEDSCSFDPFAMPHIGIRRPDDE
jgi:hypothetical protein